MEYPLVGIDEAGRGPLAGPLAVCALRLHAHLNIFGENNSIKDSKKLTEKARLELYEKIKIEAKKGNAKFAISFVPASTIDNIGIGPALKLGVSRTLETLKISSDETVLLDGNLKAPEKFVNQHTLIKGDESELAIALASIIAKVERDKKMIKLSELYPDYSLEKHKGYGTQYHRERIAEFGLSPIHRASFCKNILQISEG